MKLTALIATVAIFIMIAIVGCSNNTSTTGPADNSIQSMQIPSNGSDVNRFETAPKAPVADEIQSEVDIWGYYYQETAISCIYLKTDDSRFIELIFVAPVTGHIDNGSIVKIWGNYNSVPGGRCNLPLSFNVHKIVVVENHLNSIPGNSGEAF